MAPTASARSTSHPFRAAVVFVATGIGLSLAFFPNYFNKLPGYDDEGSFLVVVDRFIHHGSLYNHTHTGYGPFYFLYTGLIYRVLGQSPTLFTARLIVVVITMLSVIAFAAAVWKVTRSIVLGVLCEVTVLVALTPIVGSQPLHPGSMIVLLVAVMTYGFAAYAMERRDRYLILLGLATGALLMTKVNVGLFAAAAIVISFVADNPRCAKWFRVLVTIGALAMPFVITWQLLNEMEIGQFAVLVSLTLWMTLVAFQADGIALPPRGLLVTGGAAAVAVVASCVWPLATGTSLPRLFYGVFVQPLGQTDYLTIIIKTRIEWITVVLTVIGAYLVTARRRGLPSSPVSAQGYGAALAIAGAAVLSLALVGGTTAWMPGIALLPMLAVLADVPPNTRIALRLLVPFAVLQMLHAYPVAGSQLRWGVTAAFVPAVIAIGAGLRQLPLWRVTRAPARAAIVGAVSMMVIATAAISPVTLWDEYLQSKPLDLRGARLVRVGPDTKNRLQELTRVVRDNCDTFYSAPALNSLYVFTGLPTPTGMLANWPGVLDDGEQRELAQQLRDADVQERVCIVRNLHEFDDWQASSYGKGPLGKAIAPYKHIVGRADYYTVAIRGPASR